MFAKNDFIDITHQIQKTSQSEILGAEYTDSVFMKAVKEGDVELVKKEIAGGANVNERDSYGRSALMHSALAHKNTGAITRLLITAGAQVNFVEVTGVTALMFAVRTWPSGTPDIDAIRQLIDAGAKVNAVNRRGENALMIASECDYSSVVSLLIEAGADVNAVDYQGFNTLWHAIFLGRQNADAVLKLIEAGADVNSQYDYTVTRTAVPMPGMTILMAASLRYNSNPNVIHQLITAGANVNYANVNGETALMVALARRDTDDGEPNKEVIAQLLRDGANVNHITNDAYKICGISFKWSIFGPCFDAPSQSTALIFLIQQGSMRPDVLAKLDTILNAPSFNKNISTQVANAIHTVEAELAALDLQGQNHGRYKDFYIKRATIVSVLNRLKQALE